MLFYNNIAIQCKMLYANLDLKRISIGYSGDAYSFPTGKSVDW